MAIITDYMKERLVKHLLGIETLPPVTNLRLALYTSGNGIETDTPTGEVADVNYQKQPVLFDESMISKPFHFDGFATEVSITHQALVGTMEEVDRILIAIPFELPVTPLIGQPLWYETGKITLELTDI
jgi:hypothetical protein